MVSLIFYHLEKNIPARYTKKDMVHATIVVYITLKQAHLGEASR